MTLQWLIAAMTLTATACASVTARPARVGGSSSSRGPLTVTLSAHIAPEPAQVVVRTRIEPDDRNRGLLIQWWNEDGIGGSHAISLDGHRAPLRHDCAIKSMTAGEYLVTATLTRMDGQQVLRATRIIVVPEGGTPDADAPTTWLAR